MSTLAASRLRVLGAALLFSTGGVAIKACALTGWQVACLRSAVAAVALACFFPGAWRPGGPRPLIAGIPYAATLLLFVLANKLTTAANVIFLQYTAPLYLAALEPLLLKTPLKRSDLALMLPLAGGMALCFAGAGDSAEGASTLGDTLAALAGVTWAATLLGMRWTGRLDAGRNLAVTAALWGNVYAALAAAPFALPVAVTAADAGSIAYLGIVQIGVSYALLTEASRRLSALEVSLLLLIEPVLNPVWAWWLRNEQPSGLALAGGALILAATAAHARLSRPTTPSA
ncbi:MAG: DMT family transporter [Elusimicrobia bacterium]|nr:DMT family transporter [Elusimicrobiota bacterium]